MCPRVVYVGIPMVAYCPRFRTSEVSPKQMFPTALRSPLRSLTYASESCMRRQTRFDCVPSGMRIVTFFPATVPSRWVSTFILPSERVNSYCLHSIGDVADAAWICTFTSCTRCMFSSNTTQSFWQNDNAKPRYAWPVGDLPTPSAKSRWASGFDGKKLRVRSLTHSKRVP